MHVAKGIHVPSTGEDLCSRCFFKCAAFVGSSACDQFCSEEVSECNGMEGICIRDRYKKTLAMLVVTLKSARRSENPVSIGFASTVSYPKLPLLGPAGFKADC